MKRTKRDPETLLRQIPAVRLRPGMLYGSIKRMISGNLIEEERKQGPRSSN